ncbi:MAG: hypothetical protein R2824_26715 [Saprospiraceae bacterium]
MLSIIIAVFILFFFVVVIAFSVWAFSRMHKIGLLRGFMKGKWLLSFLTLTFLVAFIASAIGLLTRADWAVPLLRYTVSGWLPYVWIYGLNKLLGMAATLKFEQATSLSQFVGRDKYFDEVLEKSIALSKESGHAVPESPDDAHGVTDSPLEEMLNDEELFRELFPIALRRKIKRQVIGLLIHTIIMLAILWAIG